MLFQKKESELVQHSGIFRRQISLFEGVALIVSGTIGAGVLGIPYAIAKVGVSLGIVYIIFIGLVMMGMNLLLGRIAIQTGEPLQLSGLARKYLGAWGGGLMTLITYSSLLAVLNVYMIGVGQSFFAIFGGSPFRWSLVFFAVEAVLIVIGTRTVKKVEMILLLLFFLVIFLLGAMTAPQIQMVNWQTMDWAQLLFPYGVLVFAFHGTTAVPEAYSILRNKEKDFKKAIILASLVVMAVYIMFTLIVVGVTGLATTEIATIGLGNLLGNRILVLCNLFAILSMGTSFLMVGVSLRHSLSWDFKMPKWLALLVACGLPLALFLVGVRQFIQAIDLIGSVLMSIELLLILAIYMRVRRLLTSKHGEWALGYSTILIGILALALSVSAVYSISSLF